MREFLHVHAHWLSALRPYAPWSFVGFIVIGTCGAIVGWLSGELAVKALQPNQLSEKYCKLARYLVRVASSVLCATILFVGVVNDKTLRDSDTIATQARDEQDRTLIVLHETKETAERSEATFNAFIKSLDPRMLNAEQFLKLMNVYKQTPKQGVIKSEEVDPLSSMSNGDLRRQIKQFAIHLYTVDHAMYDVVDRYGAAQRAITGRPDPRTPVTPEMQSNLETTQAILEKTISNSLLVDVPLAMIYKEELIKRVGSQVSKAKFPETPASNVTSMNDFLNNARHWLDDSADQLPDTSSVK
jgi:hypothetical protein